MSEQTYDELADTILWPGQVHSSYLALQKPIASLSILVDLGP